MKKKKLEFSREGWWNYYRPFWVLILGFRNQRFRIPSYFIVWGCWMRLWYGSASQCDMWFVAGEWVSKQCVPMVYVSCHARWKPPKKFIYKVVYLYYKPLVYYIIFFPEKEEKNIWCTKFSWIFVIVEK